MTCSHIHRVTFPTLATSQKKDILLQKALPKRWRSACMVSATTSDAIKVNLSSTTLRRYVFTSLCLYSSSCFQCACDELFALQCCMLRSTSELKASVRAFELRPSPTQVKTRSMSDTHTARKLELDNAQHDQKRNTLRRPYWLMVPLLEHYVT